MATRERATKEQKGVRVALFDGPGLPIRIEETDTPRPGPGDVLVKVHRCGICGSDVSMTGNAPFTYKPGPIGHEYAGEVIEVGQAVSAVKPGQRVACLPSTPCGVCEGCRHGNPVFCTAPKTAANGSHGFGGFGEYVLVPAGGAIPLPSSLSFSDGALIEPMACGLHALRMARMAKNARILVLGAGSMALSIIFWARRLGAGRIVVASRSAHRRDVTLAMGADAFHSFSEDEPSGLTQALQGAADLVAECVGKDGMLTMALDHVRPQGTVVSLGMCMHGESIIPAVCTFKEATVLFPLAYTVGEFIETARAFDADQVCLDMMVSEVIALEQLPDVLEDMRAGRKQQLKVLVNPSLGA